MIKYNMEEISSFASHRMLRHSNRCRYYGTIVSEIILRDPNNKKVIRILSNNIKIRDNNKYIFEII